jgi:glycosyltransferase involved in cell wall biosynthesis
LLSARKEEVGHHRMNYSITPIVSVVIVTRGRTSLVLKAIGSALTQTLREVEVVVVIDGPDPETIEALANIADFRLHVITLPLSVGDSEARNIGIQRGRGKFVALLDEADEWVPQKLSKQLAEAQSSTCRYPVIASRFIARRPDADEIWPRRPMRDQEAMSEYLFCSDESTHQNELFLQTSTLLIPRELLLQVPFRLGLASHQDWDWLIRVAAYPGVKITYVWDALVICHVDAARIVNDRGRSTELMNAWINGNDLVTPKARAYFYATQVAVRCDSLPSFLAVVRRTIRYPRAFLIAMSVALGPHSLLSEIHPRSVSNHA